MSNLNTLNSINLFYNDNIIPVNKFTGDLSLQINYDGEIYLLWIDERKNNPTFYLGKTKLTKQQAHNMREHFICETGDFESEPYYLQDLILDETLIDKQSLNLKQQVKQMLEELTKMEVDNKFME